jgi:hypothetical protein
LASWMPLFITILNSCKMLLIIRIIGFFFENRLHWLFKEEKKFYKRLF